MSALKSGPLSLFHAVIAAMAISAHWIGVAAFPVVFPKNPCGCLMDRQVGAADTTSSAFLLLIGVAALGWFQRRKR